MNRPLSASPRFDSNRAWQEASGAVNANRDALIALAGVGYLIYRQVTANQSDDDLWSEVGADQDLR